VEPLVAVAFDGDANLRVIAQEVSGLGERSASVGTNVRFVEIKVGVLDFLQEESIQVRGRSGLFGRLGALTVTRAVEFAEPPGPLAVIVYVVESAGVTFVEPSAVTVPTSGAMVSCVALVEVQLRVESRPC